MTSGSSSSSGNCFDDSERFSDALKEVKKSFCENGTMDELRVTFEERLRNIPSHRSNVECVQNMMSSEDLSYEEVFKALGGQEFAHEVKDEDLDGVLKKLVKRKIVALPEEELEKLFKEWDNKFKFPAAEKEHLFKMLDKKNKH